jgi:hypothetical protein
MNDNRYAPPNSPVGDRQPEPALKQRPREIVLAVQLTVTQYVMGIVLMVFSWDYYSGLQSVGQAVFTQLFGVAFGLFIWAKIYHGRNWARILLLVSSVLGLAAQVALPEVTKLIMAAPVLVKLTMISSIAMTLINLWLLFLSPGREWFRKT